MAGRAHFILYVADQEASRRFYAAALARAPELDVPGMTEFAVGEAAVVGLMPERGIRRLLGLGAERIPEPGRIRGELYLVVDDPQACHDRALRAGARELSPLARRDWGHTAAYSLDLDGYVLAFARAGEGGP